MRAPSNTIEPSQAAWVRGPMMATLPSCQSPSKKVQVAECGGVRVELTVLLISLAFASFVPRIRRLSRGNNRRASPLPSTSPLARVGGFDAIGNRCRSAETCRQPGRRISGHGPGRPDRCPSEQGFYHADTRLLSSWRIFANGAPWDLLNAGNIAYYAARIYLTNTLIVSEQGDIPAGTLGLTVGRCLSGGLHEDLDLVNHGQRPVQFNLEIAARSDFADLFEVKSGHIVRRGHIVSDWSQRGHRLRSRYENEDFRRELVIKVRRAGSPPVYANGRISFEIDLAPGEKWHTCMLYEVFDGQQPDPARRAHCIGAALTSRLARRLSDWQARR